MSKKNKGNNLEMYNIYYSSFLSDLVSKAVSIIEWKGFPDTIDVRFIEYTLMLNGCGIFFINPDDDKFIFTKTTWGSQGFLDIYNLPTVRTAYAVNGLFKNLNESNSVLCFNSFLRSPILPKLKIYAEELARLKMTIRSQLNRAKSPIVAYASNTNVLNSIRNLVNDYETFEDTIYLDKIVDVESISTITLLDKGQFIVNDLQDQFNSVWREALNFIGISTQMDKKERVIVGEMLANNGDVEIQRYNWLNSRRQALEQLKIIFPEICENVTVDFRSNSTEIINEGENFAINTADEGGVKNGEI